MLLNDKMIKRFFFFFKIISIIENNYVYRNYKNYIKKVVPSSLTFKKIFFIFLRLRNNFLTEALRIYISSNDEK